MAGVRYRQRWLTFDAKRRIIARAMFSQDEQRAIELKAIEQAMRAAQVFHVELEPLLPVGSRWPFVLTEHDEDFLRVQGISPA